MKKYLNADGVRLTEGMRVEGLIFYNTPYGGNTAWMEATLIKNRSGKALVLQRDDGFIYSMRTQESFENGQTVYHLTPMETEEIENDKG